jgi:hypothetical protein
MLDNCSGGTRNWDAKSDLSTLTDLAGDFHIPAVQLHDALNNGEAEPGTSQRLRARFIHAEEAVKDARQSFRRNAYSSVGNFNTNGRRLNGCAEYD